MPFFSTKLLDMKSIKTQSESVFKMKLKDTKISPVGGWFYSYQFAKDGNNFTMVVRAESYRTLIANVKTDMRTNGHPIPDGIEALIEDQICQRQPSGKCWYEAKVGDQLANAIHFAARQADKVLGTSLEKKAKGCSSCNKRRQKLNSI